PVYLRGRGIRPQHPRDVVTHVAAVGREEVVDNDARPVGEPVDPRLRQPIEDMPQEPCEPDAHAVLERGLDALTGIAGQSRTPKFASGVQLAELFDRPTKSLRDAV